MAGAMEKLAVAGLSRRVAHAAYALLAAIDEHGGPVYSREVAVRDPEAPNARSTTTALMHAERSGLAAAAGPVPVVWIATPLCHELKGALEDRFLTDTQDPAHVHTDKKGERP
jgi:hypothetical protein